MRGNNLFAKAKRALAACVAALMPAGELERRNNPAGWNGLSRTQASSRTTAQGKRAAKKKRNRANHRAHVQASSAQGGANKRYR